jgi:hypothetical protein
MPPPGSCASPYAPELKVVRLRKTEDDHEKIASPHRLGPTSARPLPCGFPIAAGQGGISASRGTKRSIREQVLVLLQCRRHLQRRVPDVGVGVAAQGA